MVTIVLQRSHVCLFDEEEPKASDEVKVDNEEHVVVEHLHHNLRSFLHVGLRDERRNPEHTINFEDTNDG